ncbi:MAG: aminotransferase class III-fold pyridoxal phosphate-dependent enzyme [Thermoanaerobaculia bacterium]|nr:aminotransferase class III-fold pyridoxal phosphate-dependent enzyme [Thermoanaerobaculia bacterium]
MAGLGRGDLPPRLRTPVPGPRSRALSRALARHEAPGINTLPAGGGPTLVWDEARGANVLDVDGNRFVDLTSGFGVAALGHRPPAVVAAVCRQAGRLVHGLGDVHAHPLRAELAARLAVLVPVDEPRIYFAISGGDAVEIALKTALLATGRRRIVAFAPSYHGLTLGALALTSRPAFRSPFAAHLSPEVVRLPYACPPAELAALLAGEPPVAAVVVEPVVGREGILVPPPGWLAEIAAACRARGTLLVADEILTAFGRTGTRFAVDADGVRPDLLCCGKALAGGLPLAAVAGRRELMAAWERGGEALHTATFVAHPLACAAALAALPRLASPALLTRVRRLGAAVGRRLAGWPERFAAVAAVRGRGLLWGVELRSAAAAEAAVAAARDRGVLWLAGGPEGRVAQILPPLTIAERQLAGALDRLEGALAASGGARA